MRPPFIGNYLEFLDEDDASYPGSDELLSIGSAVGKRLGLQKIGIHIETLLPGRRTSYPHAESEEEEFAYVIEGNPDVWINGEIFPLRLGDFVALPSGTGIAHTFINNASYPAKLLVGGEARKTTNKIIYPLNDEMNLIKKTHETLWENAPKNPLGPHNGLPDKPNSKKWNQPTLETDRLILRPIEMSDAQAIFDYAKNPISSKYGTWEPHQSIKDSEKHIINFYKTNAMNGGYSLAICLKNNPQQMLGDVNAFHVSRPHKIMELGAIIHPDYWGRGLVGEALKRLVQHCWETQEVVRIQSRCFKENKQSFSMMKKMGMRYEGTAYSSFFAKGRSVDMEVFSLIRD